MWTTVRRRPLIPIFGKDHQIQLLQKSEGGQEPILLDLKPYSPYSLDKIRVFPLIQP